MNVKLNLMAKFKQLKQAPPALGHRRLQAASQGRPASALVGNLGCHLGSFGSGVAFTLKKVL
jgi:hypothetical protein